VHLVVIKPVALAIHGAVRKPLPNNASNRGISLVAGDFEPGAKEKGVLHKNRGEEAGPWSERL
jgi:hypothetical protein